MLWGVTGTEFTPAKRWSTVLTLRTVSDMKKIFGLKPGENRRDDKENEKAHSSFIGKKFNVGKHPVVVEVGTWTLLTGLFA